MSIEYPWPEPPQRDQIVVRLRPGQDPGTAVTIEWEGEFFVGARNASDAERRSLPEDPMVFASPGLFDVQINGFWGRGFKDVDLGPEGIRDLCWSILLSGTTWMLPTVTTDALDTMRNAMANIDAACQAFPDVATLVAGIHQEGPWISPANGPRGAHAPEHVIPPDLDAFEELQQASGGRLRLLTVAPEVEGMIDFIRGVAERGVVVSLGHHQADGPTIDRAIEAGARKVTHLGNGCQGVMPRHPNILWIQAAEDRLHAGIITDGHHLPPETAKVFYRAKPHDKLIVVSDAISEAGTPAGLYHTRDAVAEMTPEGWFGFYGTRTLMGAAVPVARCLANLTAFVGEGKTPADYMAHVTTVPGKLMGVADVHASLGTPGTAATFVVWRWEKETPNLVPQRIVLRGRTVYDAESLPTEVPFGRLPKPATKAEAEQWLATQQRI
jgi:N-acetylglucosamine-6-phosphate deacetylase